MNYVNYELKIVQKFGIELTGWPVHGPIRNPGFLDSDDMAILKRALDNKECKWRTFTQQEAQDREKSNRQRAANGEPVYGPARKNGTQKEHVIVNDMQVDDHVVDGNTD